MTVSSTKNPLPNRRITLTFLLLSLLGGSLISPASARADLETDWKLRYDFRYGYHLLEPRDLATDRHQGEIGGKLVYSHWSLVGDVRAYVEGAYATNSTRYQGPVVTQESSEILLRDLYLQYRDDHWLIRAGNQQVVWGEAFGFYYADVVNPKDLRELGVGDLEAERLQTPMLSAKYILGDCSLQAVYIPQPFFDKIPHVGSDFAQPFLQGLPALPITVNDPRTAPLALANSELGARATALVSGIDLSAFYLWYLDRMPALVPRLDPGTGGIIVDGVHSRISTFGATATADLSLFLLRVETLYTVGRAVSGVVNGSYALRTSDQMTGVIGLDYTQFEKWRVGIQVSEAYFIDDVSGPLTPRSLPLVSLHVEGTVWPELLKNQTLDVTLSYVINDGSTFLEARYWIPATDQLEIGAGADLWQGGLASQFGQFQQASRAYLLLKAYLNK